MSEEYVEIPYNDPTETEPKIGTHVWVKHVAEVIGYGRSAEADQHWSDEHIPVLKCVYGDECDALVDAEGPIVRFGDGHVAWFPGQSMGALEPVSEGHEQSIRRMNS